MGLPNCVNQRLHLSKMWRCNAVKCQCVTLSGPMGQLWTLIYSFLFLISLRHVTYVTMFLSTEHWRYLQMHVVVRNHRLREYVCVIKLSQSFSDVANQTLSLSLSLSLSQPSPLLPPSLFHTLLHLHHSIHLFPSNWSWRQVSKTWIPYGLFLLQLRHPVLYVSHRFLSKEWPQYLPLSGRLSQCLWATSNPHNDRGVSTHHRNSSSLDDDRVSTCYNIEWKWGGDHLKCGEEPDISADLGNHDWNGHTHHQDGHRLHDRQWTITYYVFSKCFEARPSTALFLEVECIWQGECWTWGGGISTDSRLGECGLVIALQTSRNIEKAEAGSHVSMRGCIYAYIWGCACLKISNHHILRSPFFVCATPLDVYHCLEYLPTTWWYASNTIIAKKCSSLCICQISKFLYSLISFSFLSFSLSLP